LTSKIAEDAAWWRTNARHTEAMVAYCASMGRKYEHAARYPWLEVTPDPPMPYWSGATDAPRDELVAAILQENADLDPGASRAIPAVRAPGEP